MILVTGASGLLGAAVVSLAHRQGFEVVGLCHRHQVDIPGISLRCVDLTSETETCRVFEELRPSAIVHCAAATNVDWCEQHAGEAYELNVTMSERIAQIASRIHAQLLYISTDSVFDGAGGPYAEGDPPAPLNIYAQTKLKGEQEVMRITPSAAIARVTFYGWNVQSKQSLAEWILQKLVLGETVQGFRDVIFCPILTDDLAQVLLALLERNLTGLYHVVGPEPMSKYEFAHRLACAFGFDPNQIIPASLAEAKLSAARPRDTSLNTNKICSALGRAMPDVDSGIRRFMQMRNRDYARQPRSGAAGVEA